MISHKLSIFLNILTLIILGISIILNLSLYRKAKYYYLESNSFRLDPIGLNNYPITIDQRTNKNQTRVVFFGDSRAFSWISPEINNYEFINRGIGGQTSLQTSSRFAYHVNSLQPDIIIIQIGINDLKMIGLFPDRRDEIVANCKKNIQRIVEDTRKIGAVAIVTTIFPVGEVPIQRQPFWSDDITKAVKEVNAYIATLAGEKTLIFDAFKLLADNQGIILSEYKDDELHLNTKGYILLNQNLVPLLQNIKK